MKLWRLLLSRRLLLSYFSFCARAEKKRKGKKRRTAVRLERKPPIDGTAALFFPGTGTQSTAVRKGNKIESQVPLPRSQSLRKMNVGSVGGKVNYVAGKGQRLRKEKEPATRITFL